ncbi:MAG: type 1 glutamine amidotransferase [Prosthecochloris sp.]|nr:type 1 glutamine amidotransferase [Prosthecochloris sp.]
MGKGKSLLIQQHIDHEGPGLLEEFLQQKWFGYDIVHLDRSANLPDPEDYDAVITLGGPQSANDSSDMMRKELIQLGTVLEHGIPYLGICLGMQTLAKAAGGTVRPCTPKETGFYDSTNARYEIQLTQDGANDPLFQGLAAPFGVFQLHGETVDLNDRITLLGFAISPQCHNQVIRVGTSAYGIQCHFELTPEMFLQWLDTDPDLKAMDRKELERQFGQQWEAYAYTGRTLLANFLHLAGLL